MAVRYLGPTLGERYPAAVADDIPNAVRVLLHPQRWWPADFSKLVPAR